MSSVQSEISRIPRSITFIDRPANGKMNLQVKNLQPKKPDGGEAKLLVKGQGVLVGKITDNKLPFSFFVFENDNELGRGFMLEIKANGEKPGAANFYYRDHPVEKEGQGWELVKNDVSMEMPDEFAVFVKSGAGLDLDPNCRYWFSLDSHNRLLRYGKGEVRKNTLLAELHYEAPKEKEDDRFAWMAKVGEIAFTGDDVADIQSKENHFIPVKLFRDPLTVDPAMYVVHADAITMDDIARNKATVVANLTPTCQQLYQNVAGHKFELNTPDFPNFTEAIEASIASPQGWCYQELMRKSTEFGGEPNPDETYLRITMGINGGDSPGVPFVMEIWPPGHYSPVHNHAGANAVIRVLHGEITVNMYPMLSKFHMNPFMVAKFGKGDVTWISPELNQTHQLHNTNVNGPTCITIQCYMYSDDNTEHYDYFDYLNTSGQIDQFKPNSDCDFLGFKEKMRKEWISLFNTK